MLGEDLLEVEDARLLERCAPGQGVRLFLASDRDMTPTLPDSQCLMLRRAEFLSPVSTHRLSFAGIFEALWHSPKRFILRDGRLGARVDGVWKIDWLIAGYHPQKAGWFYIPINGAGEIKPLFYAEHALQLGRHLFVRGIGARPE